MNLTKKFEELIEKGLDLYAKGDFKKAERYFRESYRFFKRNNMLGKTARALKYLTDLYLELELEENVLDYLKELLNIYNKLGNVKKKIEVIANIGRTYGKRGNTKLAHQYYENGLELSNKHNYKLARAYILFNFSEDLKNEGRMEEALLNLNEAGKIFLEYKEYDKSIAVYLSLLNIFRLIQKVDFFQDNIHKIEKILPLMIENRTLANTFINLALSLQYLGEYDKSIYYLNRSIELSKRLNIESIQAYALMNLGFNHVNLNNYDLAEKSFNNALDIFKKLKSGADIGRVYNGLGLIDIERDELDDAINKFEVSLDYAEKFNDLFLKIRNYILLEEIYEKKGEIELRFKNLVKILKSFDIILNNINIPHLRENFILNIVDNVRTYHKIGVILKSEGFTPTLHELEEIELIAVKDCKKVRDTQILASATDYIEIVEELVTVIDDMKGDRLETDARRLYSKIGYEMEWMKHEKTITDEEREILVDNSCYKGENPPRKVEIDIYGIIKEKREIKYILGECKNRKKLTSRKMIKCFIIKACITATHLIQYHKFKDNIEPKFHLVFISIGDFEDNIDIQKKIEAYWIHPKGRLINRTVKLIDYNEFIRLMDEYELNSSPYRKLKKIQENWDLIN